MRGLPTKRQPNDTVPILEPLRRLKPPSLVGNLIFSPLLLSLSGEACMAALFRVIKIGAAMDDGVVGTGCHEVA